MNLLSRLWFGEFRWFLYDRFINLRDAPLRYALLRVVYEYWKLALRSYRLSSLLSWASYGLDGDANDIFAIRIITIFTCDKVYASHCLSARPISVSGANSFDSFITALMEKRRPVLKRCKLPASERRRNYAAFALGDISDYGYDYFILEAGRLFKVGFHWMGKVDGITACGDMSSSKWCFHCWCHFIRCQDDAFSFKGAASLIVLGDISFVIDIDKCLAIWLDENSYWIIYCHFRLDLKWSRLWWQEAGEDATGISTCRRDYRPASSTTRMWRAGTGSISLHSPRQKFHYYGIRRDGKTSF